MKIIKTASLKEAQSTLDMGGAPTAPSTGFSAPQRAPAPAPAAVPHPGMGARPAVKQPPATRIDFEFHDESDIEGIQQSVSDEVPSHMDSQSEGFNYDGHGGGYHDMGVNHEINYSFTVKAVEPMTADDLPYSFSGSANAENGDQVQWEAIRDFTKDPSIAKYRVQTAY